MLQTTSGNRGPDEVPVMRFRGRTRLHGVSPVRLHVAGPKHACTRCTVGSFGTGRSERSHAAACTALLKTARFVP